MRLRLDKLVLSAGLALAMVATTIPVGAASSASSAQTTTVWAKDGTIVSNANEAFVAAIKALDTTTGSILTEDGMTKTVEATSGGAISDVTSLTDSAAASYSDDLITKITNDGYTKSGVVLDLSSNKEITDLTQTTTYTYSKTYTTVSTDTDESTAEASAIKAYGKTVLEALIDAAGSAGTTTTTPSYGTKTVVVTQPSVATATKVGTDTLTPETTKYTVSAEATVTTTYAINDVSYFGYTLSLLLTGGFDADATNLEYIVYKVDADGNITSVTPTVTDNGLVVETTDLSAKYYTAYKTVSTSDALIASAEDDATYTGAIRQITKSDLGTTAAEKLAEAIEANSAKLVAYLNVTAINTSTNKSVDETANELTFKIAVPVDVDTTGVVFKVLRYHGSSVDVLDTTVSDGYIYFTSNKFSEYALVTVAADTTTTEEATDAASDAATDSATEATTAGSSTTSTTTSTKTADNSMMPLFMTTLLLALCAGSLAIYKEKKTN